MSFNENVSFLWHKSGMLDDVAIGKRIKRLRTTVLGIKSQTEFAKRIEVTRGAVGNWELGKGIKKTNLLKIAKTFDVSHEWLATGRGSPDKEAVTNELNKSLNIGTVTVRGTVKAGQWQDVETWENDALPETVPSSSDYPLDWQYAFTVDGDSLNKIAKHGDKLVCVDLIKSMLEIQNNDLVIVERHRFDGQVVERTAKRVRQTIGGFELWPESTSPEHQAPIEFRPDGDPDHNNVHVIAKVIWVLSKP